MVAPWTALIVVDLQVGFLNAHSESVIPAVVQLIEGCRRAGVPVVCTKFINPPAGPFESLIGWTKVRESPEIDLHEAILVRADVILEKNNYSALTTRFESLALSEGWRTLLVCGISTESCVLKTAVDAFEKGFRPIVVTDACASDMGPEMHQKGLDVMAVMIGENQLMDRSSVFRLLMIPDAIGRTE